MRKKRARSIPSYLHDYMEFAESTESAENYNYLSLSIKRPTNCSSPYTDTFSWILSVKNHSNFIFGQFCIFVNGPIPKNENTEFEESFRKFHLLYQWWTMVTVQQFDHLILRFINTRDYFSNLIFLFDFFSKKKLEEELRLPKWK